MLNQHLFSDIVNVNLSDIAWLQASLLLNAAVIGIRSAVQLAPSSFLASTAGCTSMIHLILPPHMQELVDIKMEAALAY